MNRDMFLKICNELGNPTFFQYYHGLSIKLTFDEVIKDSLGGLEFLKAGESLLNIRPDDIEFRENNRPAMYLSDKIIKSFGLCQKKSKEFLGDIFWEKE